MHSIYFDNYAIDNFKNALFLMTSMYNKINYCILMIKNTKT